MCVPQGKNMSEIGPLKEPKSSPALPWRWAIGLAVVWVAAVPWSQSLAGEPLRESVRGGAGQPVVELPEVRAQNQNAEAKYHEYVEGLYVLELFRTVSRDESFEIDVWNLLVGPGKETGEFELPGTAVLLLRAGSAQVVVDGQSKSDLEMGATLVVPEKTRIRITNRAGDRPVNVRATLFSGVE